MSSQVKTVIYGSFKSFLDREDTSLNGVSPEFAKGNPDYEKDNASNTGCWNCIDCSECLYLANCKSYRNSKRQYLGMPYSTPA